MTPEEKLEKFLTSVDEWCSGHNIVYASQKSFSDKDKIDRILNLDNSELVSYSLQDCQDAMLMLNRYHTYLNIAISREKASRNWTEQGLNYLIAGKDFSQYTKWEEKKALILRDGSIAAKLQELKTVCEARILILESQIKNVEYILKIVEQNWRTKSYDRS